MKFQKNYHRTQFPPEVLVEARNSLFGGLDGEPTGLLSVEVPEGSWTHETEQEFFADYRRLTGVAYYSRGLEGRELSVHQFTHHVVIEVKAESRAIIQAVFEIFDKNLAAARFPDEPVPEKMPPSPVIFIGHGRSPLWRDLKDHLHEKQGYQVEAYEIGARAGHTIRDILQDMLRRSSFAVLVMTAEDETADGTFRARQNVIHEAGLFQGALGFSRAIVLLEEGTEAFSNIQGIDQIRFAPGNIRETFGDVIATLRREFSSA